MKRDWLYWVCVFVFGFDVAVIATGEANAGVYFGAVMTGFVTVAGLLSE